MMRKVEHLKQKIFEHEDIKFETECYKNERFNTTENTDFRDAFSSIEFAFWTLKLLKLLKLLNNLHA